VVCQDPLEKGIRAALNLGHTVGHGIEKAMDYRLDHGGAVSIGMVAEARLAERAGIAAPGMAGTISAVLRNLGLPVDCPAGIDRAAMLAAMAHDKKSAAGRLRFALPVRPGEVRTGVVLEMTPEEMLKEICP
jgi:3-dehydroquinate synthetase